MSKVYLNRGLILEQAIAWQLEKYLRDVGVDELFANFHVHVTNAHPFAAMYLEGGIVSSDSFPCVVVTCADSRKPGELANLPQQVSECTLSADDFTAICALEGKAGIPPIASESVKAQVLEWIEASAEGCVNALAKQTFRSDTISFEIWAENAELKNELFEYIRLFVASNLVNDLQVEYPFFGIEGSDNRITESRSGNYNMDFGVTLYGGQITHQLDYVVEQILIVDEGSASEASLEWQAVNEVKA